MECEEVEELLPAHLEGDLKDEIAGQVQDHLKSCPRCQKEAQLLNASWEALGAHENIEPSPDFRIRVWQRIEEEKDRHWVWFPWRQWAPVAAGLLVAWTAGVSLGVLHHQHRWTAPSSPTQVAAAIFVSPYPYGSIDHVIAGTRHKTE